MHGVLYAITPELFATKDRGTGNALTATANRIFGVLVSYNSCFNFDYSLFQFRATAVHTAHSIHLCSGSESGVCVYKSVLYCIVRVREGRGGGRL